MNSPSSVHIEKRYWAFVSYSHSDTKETDWLHKSLEGYKVPASLVGTESRNGVVPRRIFPVFRDRDELPTSADLGANLHAALRNSRYLVVLCSPKSAKSMWVNAEVEFFKRTHGSSNVLCLIVEGVPGGTGEGRQAECFCPALKYHINSDGSFGDLVEPIAADLRGDKDGRSRAFLKIVAGILGVDFDTLYQRERRRMRRRALFLSAGVIVLAAVGLVFYSRLDSVAKSQSEIVTEVKKMRDMKFRAFGELPKERAQAMGSIIEKSGVLSAEEALSRALQYEKKRFSLFRNRVGQYSRARSEALAEFESLIEQVTPSVGWAAAAKSLSQFSSFLATEEVQGRKQSIELINQQFKVTNDMKAMTVDLDEMSSGLAGSMAGMFDGIKETLAARDKEEAQQNGENSEDKDVKDSSEKQKPLAATEPKVTEETLYNKEFAISAPFAMKIDQASCLIAKINKLERILPADWIIGDTEPKQDSFYRNNRARALTHAAWLLATAPEPGVRDPHRAFELASDAVKLGTPQTVRNLDAMGAVSASVGDFDAALKWQTLAVRKGADASTQEQEDLLKRYKLYESKQAYICEEKNETAEEILVGVANYEGFESWLLSQRDKLSSLAHSLEQFTSTPEEKVVVQAELDGLRERQSQLELDGELDLNKMRRELIENIKKAQTIAAKTGYAPITEMDGIATVSEKIWLKPSAAPDRGSLKTITADSDWQKGKVDREGSVELYCIERFVFPSAKKGEVDSDKISIARDFARTLAIFLGVHLP